MHMLPSFLIAAGLPLAAFRAAQAAFACLCVPPAGEQVRVARRWAGRASALLLVLAETTDETGAPRGYALYDTGQAVAHLVTQAQAEGLSTHQMGGFDKDAAVAGFGIDPRLTPVVVIAVGLRQDEHGLPDDLAERESAPRHRRPLAELVLPTAPAIDLPRAA